MPTRHKAGGLKQTHKTHGSNGGHSSKRSLKKAQGGKVNASGGSTSATFQAPTRRGQGYLAGSKYERLVQTKQARQQKKARGLLEKRTGTSLGPPTIVLLLPLGPFADVASLAEALHKHADRTSHETETGTIAGGDSSSSSSSSSHQGAFVGVYDRHKCRLQVTTVGFDAGPLELLDAAKSADVVVAVLSAAAGGGDAADGAVGESGLRAAALLRAHGMPAVVGVCQHLDLLPTKHAGEFKRKATKFMSDEFGQHAKIVLTLPPPSSSPAAGAFQLMPPPPPPFSSTSSTSFVGAAAAAAGKGVLGSVDVAQLVRVVSECPHRSLAWRESRPYLLASAVQVLSAEEEEKTHPSSSSLLALEEEDSSAAATTTTVTSASAPTPLLAVSGYLRGAPLNVNQLVHVPGVGARRILRILHAQDPCPLAKHPHHRRTGAGGGAGMQEGGAAVLLAEPDLARVDPVGMAALPDGLMGEQTWPDMEEYAGGGGGGGGELKKIGEGEEAEAGVSDYQSAWSEAWQGDEPDGEEGDEEEKGGMGDDEDGIAGGGGRRRHVVELGSAAGSAALKRLPTSSGNKEEGGEEEGGDDGELSFLQSDGGDGDLRLEEGLDDAEMGPEELLREREVQRKQRAAEQLEFPDEVDAPVDRAAKDRFARYRSLENFRNSPWDAKESLPRDYSRLYDLGDFKATQRRVLEADSQAARRQETNLGQCEAQVLKKALKKKRKGIKHTGKEGQASSSGGGGGGGGMQDDDESADGSRASAASGATFTLPGAEDDDEEDDDDDDEELGGGVSDDEDEDLQGDNSSVTSTVKSRGASKGSRRGLGRRGWIVPGTFVTLHLAAHADAEAESDSPTGTGGFESNQEVASSPSPAFTADAAAFAVLAEAHNLTSSAVGSRCVSPMSLHGLHRHENRLTLLNCQVQRAQPLFLDEEEPVASKEEVWVVCGFRRWRARPVFSQNNLNCDKNKFERFLQGGVGNFLIASVYGPATFTPAPVLLFRQPPGQTPPPPSFSSSSLPLPTTNVQSLALAASAAASSAVRAAKFAVGMAVEDSGCSSVVPFGSVGSGGGGDSALQLVAQGTLYSADVNRLVLKRIVLTGYPQRVHKRTAVIKHMFYGPDDVRWFKPAPLFSKHGMDGHIMGPVGEHGLFKVHFGRALQSHDTVCMYLYKRVYPKFVNLTKHGGDDEGAEGEDDDKDDGRGALSLCVL